MNHCIKCLNSIFFLFLSEMAETVTGKVAGNISSVYSMIRQKTSDFQETFESLTSGSSLGEKQKSLATMSTISSNSTSEENLSMKSNKTSESKSMTRVDSTESDSLLNSDTQSSSQMKKDQEKSILTDDATNREEQLIDLVANILYTILWHGIENNGGDSWKERGQVIACINLLGLNNELYCSHLTLRLQILECGVQASLMDLSEINSPQNPIHQENAAQLLRMIYDLVVLDPNEDEEKKCSPKLLDGVLALMGKKNLTIYRPISNFINFSIKFNYFDFLRL